MKRRRQAQAGERDAAAARGRRPRSAPRRVAAARLPLAAIGTALVVAVCLAWLAAHEWPHPGRASRLPPMSAALARPAQDGRIARRAALTLARQRPVFGWGLGGYPLRQKAQTGLGRDPALIRRSGAGLTEQAHSFYLQTAAEAGVPALLLWLAALAAFFVTGLRTLARLPDGSLRRPVLSGTLAGVAAQAVDAALNPAWQYGQVQFTLWLLLGLGTACAGGLPPAAPAPAPAGRPARLARTLLLALLGALLAGLIVRTLPLLPAARV